jgi:hypothetical protein
MARIYVNCISDDTIDLDEIEAATHGMGTPRIDSYGDRLALVAYAQLPSGDVVTYYWTTIHLDDGRTCDADDLGYRALADRYLGARCDPAHPDIVIIGIRHYRPQE